MRCQVQSCLHGRTAHCTQRLPDRDRCYGGDSSPARHPIAAVVRSGIHSKMLLVSEPNRMVLQEQSTLHTERSSGRPMKVPPSPFATQSKEPDKAKSKCCGCVVQ